MGKTCKILTVLLPLGLFACREDDELNHSANIPLVSNKGEDDALASAEANLTGSPMAELSARFLNREGGPGNIPDFRARLDRILSAINSASFAVEKPCETSEPIAYLLHPPEGELEMFAQCYQNVDRGPTALKANFNQYGFKDGSNYVYAIDQGDQIAAILTPAENRPRDYQLKAIYSIGGKNSPSWSSGPYGLAELQIESFSKRFEFTAAGVGLGYCSVQMKSNGEQIFASYSLEDGESCGEHTEVCAKLSEAASAICPDDLRRFDLPLFSREPGIATVTFDGTLRDSTNFGPVLPSSGLGGL